MCRSLPELREPDIPLFPASIAASSNLGFVAFDSMVAVMAADKHRIAVHYMELGEHRLVVADAFWVSAAYNAHNAVGKLHGGVWR